MIGAGFYECFPDEGCDCALCRLTSNAMDDAFEIAKLTVAVNCKALVERHTDKTGMINFESLSQEVIELARSLDG